MICCVLSYVSGIFSGSAKRKVPSPSNPSPMNIDSSVAGSFIVMVSGTVTAGASCFLAGVSSFGSSFGSSFCSSFGSSLVSSFDSSFVSSLSALSALLSPEGFSSFFCSWLSLLSSFAFSPTTKASAPRFALLVSTSEALNHP